MHPILILLIGVVIVIAGILLFRLHAFLALTLAALVVGMLTPRTAIERYWLDKSRVSLSNDFDHTRDLLALNLNPKSARVGARFLVLRSAKSDMPHTERRNYARSLMSTYNADQNQFLERNESSSIPFASAADKNNDEKLTIDELTDWSPPWRLVAELEVVNFEQVTDSEGEKTIVAMAGHVGPDYVSIPSRDDVIIEPAKFKADSNAAKKTVGERLAVAFGTTCGKIGILIALAAIIGKCLLDSGAADRIVRSALGVVGERGAPVAFIGSGFLLGIPVFFDTVFYLVIPLGKALRMRTGRNYILYVLTIVAGATMAHSLVPPTPGPLLVAEELNVDLGVMILAGCIVGLFTSSAGLCYAFWVNRRAEVPLRESPDFSLKEIEEIARRDESQLPPLLISLLPIVLPVLLITAWTGIDAYFKATGVKELPGWTDVVKTLGNKNIALAIATAVAMGTLVWQKRTSLKNLADSIQGALASGGVIILITSAGGAFGGMLQQTGVAGLIEKLDSSDTLIVLVLAFLITTAVRTAQGSATVAMITAVGILASLAGNLGCHPVYLGLAIGCGSKPVAWMNDSGFWVICKMSGMTEAEGLRFVTPMSIIMGVVGLLITLIGATLLPLSP